MDSDKVPPGTANGDGKITRDPDVFKYIKFYKLLLSEKCLYQYIPINLPILQLRFSKSDRFYTSSGAEVSIHFRYTTYLCVEIKALWLTHASEHILNDVQRCIHDLIDLYNLLVRFTSMRVTQTTGPLSHIQKRQVVMLTLHPFPCCWCVW